MSPRPVASAIAGPTDPHVAAAFYNPAALGPLRGFHLYFDGGPRIHLGTIDRKASADSPGGSAPINWTDFDGFVGLSTDLGTDAITLGIATYAPLVDLTAYPGGSAAEYHARWLRMATLKQTAAVGLRIDRRFYFGAAVNVSETWIDYRYDRDAALAGGSAGVDQPGGLCGSAACGLENPSAAQDVRVRADGFGAGFSLGILVRPVDRLWLAASYISPTFSSGYMPPRRDRQTLITPAPGQPNPGCTTPTGVPSTNCYGNALVGVLVPDTIYVGARVEVTPRVEVEASFRWVHYGGRSGLDLVLEGGQLDRLGSSPATRIPAENQIDFGLQDAFGVEASGRFRLGEHLRLAPSLFLENSAVTTGSVNAASIDAPKLDATLTAEWRPVRHLVLGAHVGGTAYFLGEAGGGFQPRAQVACVDAGYSLDACGAQNTGNALPSADGHYTYFVIHLGAAIGIDY
jgi:long-subunit fatty acid transport protein